MNENTTTSPALLPSLITSTASMLRVAKVDHFDATITAQLTEQVAETLAQILMHYEAITLGGVDGPAPVPDYDPLFWQNVGVALLAQRAALIHPAPTPATEPMFVCSECQAQAPGDSTRRGCGLPRGWEHAVSAACRACVHMSGPRPPVEDARPVCSDCIGQLLDELAHALKQWPGGVAGVAL